MNDTGPVVDLRAVSKCYGEGERRVWALREVSLAVRSGEFVAIMGPSGSGKSSLLNVIAGLDAPTSGEVLVEGRRVDTLSDGELARLRRRTIGFVFQFFNLLPTLTAEQNVSVPLRADRRPRAEMRERVTHALTAVGMAHRAGFYPSELSGGEMQRVAIARALATEARVILADEPTGNLDSTCGEEILELLRQVPEQEERAVIMVTHDVRAAAHGDRLVTLRDGRIVDEIHTHTRADVIPLRQG